MHQYASMLIMQYHDEIIADDPTYNTALIPSHREANEDEEDQKEGEGQGAKADPLDNFRVTKKVVQRAESPIQRLRLKSKKQFVYSIDNSRDSVQSQFRVPHRLSIREQIPNRSPLSSLPQITQSQHPTRSRAQEVKAIEYKPGAVEDEVNYKEKLPLSEEVEA
mmetsp:Transcript_2089/g.3693  ORF Transcript_2089/g.3693 Transcript_2089/m.3693 type:complete len:164 (+) Transcript_2089:334-825(+)|eukprot:CAMPEP_0168609196 /NCGR_PEP_ID=MMETSP0449_2-20121227/1069_1 /TAXON_ID=1082188 /ORGANISM="Strombidium rassoulzadegani, Strain ras09" /LENGTH=163 /DNA_ID=CAMNT_0008649307 /DNA_START=244 /DNA_END=735 /DNA_ORIENTATION=-